MIQGIIDCISWLNESSCPVVVIESTGKYWVPVYNIMESHVKITLANPSYTKTFPGNKTDRRDAKWLAELHRLGLVLPSFIPPRDIRELRDLVRYRYKLIRMRTSEKLRIHNILTVCNIMLSSVATDIFGKSGMNIIKAILDNTSFDEEVLSEIVLGKMREKIPALVNALEGSLTYVQAEKLKIALDNYDNFNKKISQIEALIVEKSKPYKAEIELICTCFAVGKTSACVILAEIGNDMTKFHSASHLCSWAGLCPQNNETGGKSRSAKTKKGNRYLKSVLTQCANAVAKSTKYSRLVARFKSIKARRGHNKAIIAICRSILIAIYHMLQKNEPYRESPIKTPVDKPTNVLSEPTKATKVGSKTMVKSKVKVNST